MKKRLLSIAALAISSFIPFMLTSCGTKTETSSNIPITSIVETSVEITASSNVYFLGNDANKIKISYSISENLASLNKNISFDLMDNICDGKITQEGDSYYFTAKNIGSVKIIAKYDNYKSNIITITCKNADTTVADLMDSTLNISGGVVFGQEYDLGIDPSEASHYTIDGADGILKINENGKLEVLGLGKGKITLKNQNAVIYEGRYTVYNSVLSTILKEDLIAKGIIENKASNVENDMLSNIKELDLNGELINDPTASFGIKYLNALESLDLSNNDLTDASFLINISNLKRLNLKNNYFSDISSVVENENLEYLDLSNNNLSNITKLQFLYEIKDLDLSGNHITDVSSLSTSYSLESLNLNNNKISNFKDSLSGLEYLKELYVGNCDIPFTDIISLKYLKNIEALDISGTDPTLDNLLILNKLNKLILSDCKLSEKDITKLNNLTNLEYLDISNNDIDTVSYGNGLDASKLTKIHTLKMGGNAFLEMPLLSSFTNLKALDLSNSYNLIDVSSISNLKIEELVLDNSNSIDISENKFEDMLDSLSDLKRLSVVGGFNFLNKDLYNNLISKVENGTISLRFLDGIYVDNNTVYNYKKNVIFGMDEFLSICTLEEDGSYTINDLADRRQIVLALANDQASTATATYKFNVSKSLFRLDVFGNTYKTYDIRFKVEDRKESSFTFGFYDFNDAISKKEPLIQAASGSKIILTGDGKSTLKSKVKDKSPKALIDCYDIYIKYSNVTNSSLNIIGGEASKGENGHDADTGDREYKNGKKGYNATYTIVCNYISINKCNVKVVGGTGGEGGNGGKSTSGFLTMIDNYKKGGNGGNGGTGGTAVYCKDYFIYDLTTLEAGKGGKPGSVGKGFNDDTYWYGDKGKNGSDGKTIVVEEK
ncbi:MAG: leucine-rich repeat domain-containing protein [Acholeplasmatales bacterium]|nr:leucine-rich repeat domain-containing protein [Acholeplasmatales bacterium]